MAKRTSKRAGGEASVWERPEPALRPAPAPLSREAIVSAALTLADAEGLGAVSLRNVAAALEAGPMRLYGYVATKEELLSLLVDAVWSELNAPFAGDWRDVLRELAHRMRAANRRHPWFVSLLGGRPPFGPHALAHRELAFSALTAQRGFSSIDFVLECYRAVSAYVIGALQSENHELRALRESALTDEAYRMQMWPYIERTIATGRFPMLERVVRDAVHPSADDVFARGLALVLDGIGTRLAAAQTYGATR